MPGEAASFPGTTPRTGLWWIALLILLAATFAAFSPLLSAQFINWDDPAYVTQNRQVQEGITWKNTRWAFTTTYFGFYYPLTWLSHMLDCDLYGLWAGGHHLTSLLIHLANTVLLFFALGAMTRAPWRSLLVAGLFALHPLHVESVAWIAERKDVLSTLCLMGALLGYAWYARRPSLVRYASVFACLLLGLMAKSMLVTAPLLLLLLDFWPLGRVREFPLTRNEADERLPEMRPVWFLVLEKLPLVALSGLFSFLTLYAQRESGAVSAFEVLPLKMRLMNGLAAFGGYLGKMLCPAGLAPFYPYDLDRAPLWKAAASCALLLLVLALGLLWVRRRPFWLTGWLWYALVLLPVLGLVQVGRQSSADRYTYVSLVGVFIVLSWLTAEAAGRSIQIKKTVAVFWLASLAVLGGLSYRQAAFWKDSVTLFSHALKAADNSDVAQGLLGMALHQNGNFSEAKVHLKEAIRLAPENPVPWGNLGEILMKEGKTREAEACFRRILALDPKDARAENDLGLLAEKEGRLQEAADRYESALKMDPEREVACVNLGRVRAQLGDLLAAEALFERAIAIDPHSASAHLYLGKAEAREGRLAEAEQQFRRTLSLDPKDAETRSQLGVVLVREERYGEALEYLEAPAAGAPQSPDAELALGLAFSRLGRTKEAEAPLRAALSARPDWPPALFELANLLLATGGKDPRRPQEALELAERAFKLAGNEDPRYGVLLAKAYEACGQKREAEKVRAGMRPPSASEEKR